MEGSSGLAGVEAERPGRKAHALWGMMCNVMHVRE